MDKAIHLITEAMDAALQDYGNGLSTKGENLQFIKQVVQEQINNYKDELERQHSSITSELDRL